MPARRIAAVASLVLSAALVLPALASAVVAQYGTNDYGGFRNILPPGTNGLVDAAQLGAYEANHNSRPPHSSDQLAMYSNLTTAAPNIRASQISEFFKDATFGVASGQTGVTESPEPGVTIVRDKQFGVPHIYGVTRPALMFGIGWATAEDRLFFIDVLRHAGQGDLAAFAGGANVSMDEGVWANEPYTQQDLANQIHYGVTHSPYGPAVLSDATNYVSGINAYIAKASSPIHSATMLPAEYLALGTLPKPFSLEDLVSIATLVGGIFGKGGGSQLSNALLYERLAKKFGAERRRVAGLPVLPRSQRRSKRRGARRGPDRSGFATLMSFVDPSDPEAPTTIRAKRFPYQTLPTPSKAVSKTVALPDIGSLRYVPTVVGGMVPGGASDPGVSGSATRGAASDPGGSASPGGSATPGAAAGAPAGGGGLLSFPRSQSNALLVSAAHSASGRPMAVMGPQVAYFAPEILMEEDIHGPGVDADGAAFPGVNLYVELGHGRDYAWSATSSGQNIIDTFAVPLCKPAGGKPSSRSDYYLLRGRCVQMQTLTRSESWKPTFADSTPSGSVTFQTKRTAFGIVIARATVHGRPVVYCNLRSTYMHELDSALGFYLFNDPARMRSPRDFMYAANQIQYTFNWFYTDDKHIAYFNSGLNPVRARHTDPLFPSWSSAAWRNFRGAARTTPESLTERGTSQASHPHAIDQSYLTSWNNKQAAGYNDAATGQQYASVYRSQLLDNNINHYLAASHGKITLTDLINAMGNAGTQDLRGVEVLPYALKIIGHPSDRVLARAVGELRTWIASGAHRINRAQPGASGNYSHSDAIRIADAWWPLLIRSEFEPVLGASLLNQIEGDLPINDQPGHGTSGPHLGSSWDVGFYGIVQKDLRAALGLRVRGVLNRIYCGRGSLSRCRAALERSLRAAAAAPATQVYPADSVCKAGDQMCSDSINFRPVGAVRQPLIDWVNRPTFQQVVEVKGHGPR